MLPKVRRDFFAMNLYSPQLIILVAIHVVHGPMHGYVLHGSSRPPRWTCLPTAANPAAIRFRSGA
jgi:hypothetical protein